MFDWVDDIYFVAFQLNHYLGIGNWPLRLCAECVGCSISSVKKYYLIPSRYYCISSAVYAGEDPEKEDLIKKEMLKLKFENYEIELLTAKTYKFYLNIKTLEVNKQFIKKEKLFEEEFKEKIKEFQTKYSLSESWPDNSGVYLLAQIVSVPTRPEDKYYIIKVGKSVNLNQRINSYKGMNPFAICIDIQQTSSREVNATEIKYHQLLNKKYYRQGNTEWFIVPEEDYEKILKKGFDAF